MCVLVPCLIVRFGPGSLLRFFLPRQLRRWIIHLAPAILLYFVAEGRPVILLAGESIRLPLVIPALGIEPLRFFKVRNGFHLMSGFIALLAQAKLRCRLRDVGIVGCE